MSWPSKKACGVAAAGAIQGFRLFRDEESSITLDFSPVDFSVAAVALQSALQDKEFDNIGSSKKKAQLKEESLRTVMYLSCWAPN